MTQFIDRSGTMDWNTVITQELQQAGIPYARVGDIPSLASSKLYDKSTIMGVFKKPALLRFNTEDTDVVFERRSGSYSVYDSNIPVEVAIEIARSEHGPQIRPDNTPDEDQITYILENVEVFDFKTRKHVCTRLQLRELYGNCIEPIPGSYIINDDLSGYYSYIPYYKIHSVEGLRYFADVLRKYKLVEDV